MNLCRLPIPKYLRFGWFYFDNKIPTDEDTQIENVPRTAFQREDIFGQALFRRRTIQCMQVHFIICYINVGVNWNVYR